MNQGESIRSSTVWSALLPLNTVTAKSQIISPTEPSLWALQWHKIKAWTIYKAVQINSLNFQLLTGSVFWWGTKLSLRNPTLKCLGSKYKQLPHPFPPKYYGRAVTLDSYCPQLGYCNRANTVNRAFQEHGEHSDVITSRCLRPGRSKHSCALGLCRNFPKTEENQ